MRLTLKRPLVFFDIESTGPDAMNDRIIDLAAGRVMPDGTRGAKMWRLNPGCPIPAEATKIHGITDADVETANSFKDVAHEIFSWFKDVDVAGYNAVRFDCPMLDAEFSRAGFQSPLTDETQVLDGFQIFSFKEPRTLEAAVRKFCGHEHEGAHGAVADMRATFNVIEAQLEAYADLPDDVAEIAKVVGGEDKFVDRWTRKLRIRPDGEIEITFGNYRGKTLRELAQYNRGYLDWIQKNDFHPTVKAAVRDALSSH